MRLVRGLYDLPLTNELREWLARGERSLLAQTSGLDDADSDALLARHVARIVQTILAALSDGEGVRRQAEICNEVLAALGRTTGTDLELDALVLPPQRLEAVFEPSLKGRSGVTPFFCLEGRSGEEPGAADRRRIRTWTPA